MSVILQVVLAFLVIGLAGCATPEGVPGGMPARDLAKGQFSGIQEETEEVIKDRKEWEQFWARHSGTVQPPPPVPAVDFDQEMVIAVNMGRRTTGGYSIAIADVERVGGRLKITVQESSPPEEAFTIQALTAPFHFVAVPRSDLEPEFARVAE